jgi:hypothetical protein
MDESRKKDALLLCYAHTVQDIREDVALIKAQMRSSLTRISWNYFIEFHSGNEIQMFQLIMIDRTYTTINIRCSNIMQLYETAERGYVIEFISYSEKFHIHISPRRARAVIANLTNSTNSVTSALRLHTELDPKSSKALWDYLINGTPDVLIGVQSNNSQHCHNDICDICRSLA